MRQWELIACHSWKMSAFLRPSDLQVKLQRSTKVAEVAKLCHDCGGITVIVCHEHKFIFLKTRKTAGTSAEMLLSSFCGESDVITQFGVVDEKKRRDMGIRASQNFYVPYRKFSPWDWARLCIKFRRAYMWEHMPAELVSQRLDKDVWNSYLKFGIERNPWDKAISLYYWRTHEMNPRPSISDFLRTVDRTTLSNYGIYSIRGEIVVDRILQFARLEEELTSVASDLGISDDQLVLPKAKTGYRRSKRSYRELLCDEDRQLIASVCSREIEKFGYEF